jgi:hypothetical protein
MARPVLSACSRWTSHPVAKSKERNSDLVTSPKHTRYTLNTHHLKNTLKRFWNSHTEREHTTGAFNFPPEKKKVIRKTLCLVVCVKEQNWFRRVCRRYIYIYPGNGFSKRQQQQLAPILFHKNVVGPILFFLFFYPWYHNFLVDKVSVIRCLF